MDSRKLPLVSVLIPTYNRPEYLEVAIQSVLRQTYKNIEIIVCDNSENDQSEIMMNKIMEDHKNIRYYKNEENIEGFYNLLKCYQLSNGSLINFLMDDDVFHQEKISMMTSYILNYPDVVMVTSNKQYINEKGELLKDEWIIKLSNSPTIFDGKELSAFFVTNILNVIGEPTTPLFRKDSLDGMFGHFRNRKYMYCADNASWLTILSHGRLAYIPDKLSYCRLHSHQAQNDIISKISEVKDWYYLIGDSYEANLISKNQYKIALMKYVETFQPYIKYYDGQTSGSSLLHLNIVLNYLKSAIDKYTEIANEL